MKLNSKKTIVTAILLITLFACARPPVTVTKPEDALDRASTWRTPPLRDDREFKDIADAARKSLEYYKKLPLDTPFLFGPEKVTTLDMVVTLQNFLLIVENDSLSAAQKTEHIRQGFSLYRAVGSDGGGKVLFTGYYEPMLSCRVAADDTFRFPLYRRPDDIIEIDLTLFGNGFPKNKIFGRLDDKKVIPYYSREEIDQKKLLGGKDLEILWCNDIIDIYVLQVQGSGKVDLGDGNIMSVLYDGANGRPYKSIGKYLIDTGSVARKNMSMQAIRAYLKAHPERVDELFFANPSYVFFRVVKEGPLGNIEVPITPGRSIATDSRLFPKGGLALVQTQRPVVDSEGRILEWRPFSRFVLNQDTGGSILGPGRVDLYCGAGMEAEVTAGHLKHDGKLYFLLKRQ